MSSNWYAESGTALILDEKETIEFCKKYLKEICGRDMREYPKVCVNLQTDVR